MGKYNSKEQQDRFFEHHKSFKVYLSTEEDMDIIKNIMQSKCVSHYIKNALEYYVHNIGKECGYENT